ncbi:hypothetical protein HUZ36_15570 [Pseudoalteromonas sp. McH1-7]|uniref:DUF541 domain-containing protein n=1 Tax=Pseudoalteromonas peptidolytica F12-50-A1 TaxID=1315280 RepID=A0A8I0MZ35_9GAMM|nr:MULTISPECIES: hypothetical protein [Pseudoalteromonas]MBE0348575.1 hypothetical protein [Pseudoalteromonas peptidolytica F12-50-A1]MDW7548461.1 hypothetical protein [Pseudoalteromonas peptidolytica]NLR15791.1 hypothetical protein [Pseudoalteromonas peptidolytica]NUZ12203.1 hypothetical protein [Pseudoalteromonas sp. McH1-7]RXF01304.1 hypothetical protein D9603_13645 [Pseudoalteromonas sp. PS5]
MLKVATLVLSLFAFNAYADFSAIVIAYDTGDVPVNGSIDIEAEYIAMSVTLSSDAKYPSERAKLIKSLQNSIRSAASKSEGIDFQQGVISLSPQEKSSFSISKSYGRSAGSSFYILSKLRKGKDVYSATQDIYSFINRIKRPEDTSLRLGNTSLAISSPSEYRASLLEKIKLEINTTKEALGTGYKVSISGLENPVIVRQKDDKQVTLFIDYQVQFSE